MNNRRLHFFTDPYPGELITSAVSRYLNVNKGFIKEEVFKELFGISWLRPSPFFLNRLNYLASGLGDEYQPQQILMENTVFPFFAPFIIKERRDKVLEALLSASFSPSHLLGINKKSYPSDPVRYRYCPVCAKLDVQNFGEPYFHVMHQLPGIDVCPLHLVWLEDYPIESWESYYQFLVADIDMMDVPPHYCDCEHEVRLAESAMQVLNGLSLEVNGEDILSKFDQTYMDRGFVHGKKTKFTEIYKLLTNFYGEDYLKLKGCFIPAEKWEVTSSTWLSNLCLKRNRGVITPYKALLVINCFYDNYNIFLSVPNKTSISNITNWECINPACPDFKNHEKTTVTVQPSSRQSRVIVRCNSCGMVYTSDVKKLKKPTVLQYGQVWFDKIHQMLDEGSLKKDVMEYFGISRQTLNHALKTNDPNPVDRRVYQARNELERVLAEHPDFNRTEFRKGNSSTYQILRTHDLEWFDKRLPPKQSSYDDSSSLLNEQYQQLDEKYLESSKKAYAKFLDIVPPMRITHKHFLNELGISYRLLKNLPKTRKFIHSKVDDGISFNIRKGCYCVDKLIEEGIHVSRNQLRNMGVYSIYRPEVSEKVIQYYNDKMNNYPKS